MTAGLLLLAGCGGDPVAERDPESESTDGASATPAPTPDPVLDLTGPADPAAKREFAQAMRATLLEGTGSFQHRLTIADQGGIYDRGRYDLEATTSALTRVAEAGTGRRPVLGEGPPSRLRRHRRQHRPQRRLSRCWEARRRPRTPYRRPITTWRP